MTASNATSSLERPTTDPDSGVSGTHPTAGTSPDRVQTGKRERNKAQNRRAIIEAAQRVFTDIGYGAATVRDIIRRTDLAAGTFYNYFPDKESVFLELLNDKLRLLNEGVAEARRSATDAESFFQGSYFALFTYMASDRDAFELLRRNAGTVRALIDASIYDTNVEESVRDIERAIEAGILPPVDAEFLASAMAGISFELCVRMVEREPLDVDAAARFAATLISGGVQRLAEKNEG
jgi:AcrR family transcriptional regulator